MKTNVFDCVHCDSDHYGLEKVELKVIEIINGLEFTHVAQCPNTGKAIYIREVKI